MAIAVAKGRNSKMTIKIDVKSIDAACHFYTHGDINCIELSHMLHEAGIPKSLIELVGMMHDDNIKLIRAAKCKSVK